MEKIKWNLPYTMREFKQIIMNCNSLAEIAAFLKIYDEELEELYCSAVTVQVMLFALGKERMLIETGGN